MLRLQDPVCFVQYRSMQAGPSLANIAAMIGNPARALMLGALLDGRSRSAGELARAAGITPQTASAHLTKLVDAGLLAIAKQGRHRYHRLASRDVAHALEALMALSSAPAKPPMLGPADLALRHARTCYDHMAGEIAVRLADHWLVSGWIREAGDEWLLTPSGSRGIESLGIRLPEGALRRPQVRPCLDWSERRPHIGGQLGACLLESLLSRGWGQRRRGSRALRVTDEGRRGLSKWRAKRR
jgi:DNA-binding transcriptional ArsR family regulator